MHESGGGGGGGGGGGSGGGGVFMVKWEGKGRVLTDLGHETARETNI